MAKKTISGSVTAAQMPARYRRFSWKEHTNFPIAAGAAAQRIDHLKAQNNNEITPEDIVNDARPAQSLFHPCFEWDNRIAAEAHRRSRAMEILRGLQIVRGPSTTPPVRYMRSVTLGQRQGSKKARTAYIDIHRAARSKTFSEEILEDALNDLKAFAKSYAGHSRISGISLLIAGVNNLIAQASRVPVTSKKRNR